MNIDKKYFPALSKVFTPIVMDSLALKGRSAYLSEVCLNSGLLHQLDFSMTINCFFDLVYNFLFKNYRNEYIYKNAIANKIMLGKHSLATSQMITEFRVGKCKADVVILNGSSMVYEIKSEFDSFDRLENQIKTYLEIFDYINVITSDSQVGKIKAILPDKIGIQILTTRNTISTVRDATSNKINIKTETLFNSFRKAEYTAILKDFYGKIPEAPSALFFTECKKAFCNIPVKEAHHLAIKYLKKRNNTKLLKDFVEHAPDSLMAYAFTLGAKNRNVDLVTQLLKKDIGTLFSPIPA